MSEDEIEIINPNEKKKYCIWTIRWYLFLLCSIVLCQSMITSGYIGSIVSSIESYYGFSTEELGIAFSSYDIIGLISIPLISYIGPKSNRAKIVAFGAFLFSIGNIIFILPYLINGYNKDNRNNSSNETSDYLCSQNISINSFSSNSIFNYFIPNLFNNQIKNEYIINQPTWTYYTFILSMIIMSIGSSPFYTLGITFLTDHLNKDEQPIYTSILYGMVALGPAIGFLMGSVFVSKWININDQINIDIITKNDPRWIGRWWGGFILSSCLLIILSIILFTFPSNLNSNINQSDNNINEVRSSSSYLSNIKDIFINIIDLLKNVTYILTVFVNAIESILVVLFTTFLVKYIESVFNISSSMSSILTGSIVVPAGIFGTISGGYIVRRYNMNIYECIKFLLICCLIGLIGLIILFFIKCKSNLNISIDNQCSKLCNCSPHIYEPVCFENKINYISPCYAGCTSINGTEYTNCQCLLEGNKVSNGLCKNNCLIKLILFLLILFLVTYIETLMATPQLIIILRSVKNSIQSFSLGFENCLMKFFAQIPAPILIGIIIDKQCLYWSESTYNHRGSCFIYNGNQLTFTLFGTTIIIKIISIFILIILFFIKYKQKNKHLLDQEQQHLLN